ncbi:MAG: tRNA preQ1(34) S-adenosylmethionine ribosyltransferase-isomerase QueA [Candidatus Eisenbacteria bacterium]|nr:tRNA preQ1(34) S-adenosylmethionine ribosyltransferase-isomerase QueA [Candidatus Eisenbacteria bacterium]
MKLEDLDYDLPPERIAQHPAARREDARLLVVERATGVLHDQRIPDLDRWLKPGDALALNETRVIPARLAVRRASGGRVELLFVRPAAAAAASPGADAIAGAARGERWRVLARPAKRVRPGETLASDDGALALEVVEAGEGAAAGERVVRVARGDLAATLARAGELPLPPYIHRAADAEDRERYQTVFARVDGAIAAPTAGLHFTAAHLAALEAAGVGVTRVLLHVGPGTFRPVTVSDPRAHRMDEEYFEVGADAAARLAAARARGGRIVAVGTTVVRALESACDRGAGALAPASGWTRAFIVPPYTFRAVDALLTNFHLPRTTLLLLVAAFMGEDLLRRAYAHAVATGYRFYSYGDAMLIV